MVIKLLNIGEYVKVVYESETFLGVVEKINFTKRNATVNVMVRSGHHHWKWPTLVD